MARHKGKYFRRSVRQGSKVRTVYYGKGLYGEMSEILWLCEEEMRSLARRIAREQREAELRYQLLEFREWKRELELVDKLIAIGIEALGYHRPGRNPWRRKRKPRKAVNIPAVAEGELESIVTEQEIMDGIRDYLTAVREGGSIEMNAKSMIELAKRDPVRHAALASFGISEFSMAYNLAVVSKRLMPKEDENSRRAFVLTDFPHISP